MPHSSLLPFPSSAPQIAEEVQRANGGARRRTAIACLRRFQTALNTNLIKKWDRWTRDEDDSLAAAIKVGGERRGPK